MVRSIYRDGDYLERNQSKETRYIQGDTEVQLGHTGFYLSASQTMKKHATREPQGSHPPQEARGSCVDDLVGASPQSEGRRRTYLPEGPVRDS